MLVRFKNIINEVSIDLEATVEIIETAVAVVSEYQDDSGVIVDEVKELQKELRTLSLIGDDELIIKFVPKVIDLAVRAENFINEALLKRS